MRQPVLLAAPLLLTLLLAGSARAQFAVQGGNVTMTISTALAGAQPDPVSASTTSLRWRRQSEITKITVSTVCPGQKFSLRVRATGATEGAPAPEVVLVNGMAAVDIIRDIPPRSGPPPLARATLEYTASATFEQGNSTELGPDVHTVTYTHVAQ